MCNCMVCFTCFYGFHHISPENWNAKHPSCLLFALGESFETNDIIVFFCFFLTFFTNLLFSCVVYVIPVFFAVETVIH